MELLDIKLSGMKLLDIKLLVYKAAFKIVEESALNVVLVFYSPTPFPFFYSESILSDPILHSLVSLLDQCYRSHLSHLSSFSLQTSEGHRGKLKVASDS